MQSTDIPVKKLKDNGDMFGDYIWLFFNKYVDTGKFPDI